MIRHFVAPFFVASRMYAMSAAVIDVPLAEHHVLNARRSSSSSLKVNTVLMY